jgi:hypothetical protein
MHTTTVKLAAVTLLVLAASIAAQKVKFDELPDELPLSPFTRVPVRATKKPPLTIPPELTLTLQPATTTAAPSENTTTAAPPTTTTEAPTTTTATTLTTTPTATSTTSTVTNTTTTQATPTTSLTTLAPATTEPAPPTTPTPPSVNLTATPNSTTNLPPPPSDEVITAAPTDLTEPPVQTVVPRDLQFRAVFQISGSRWGLLLNNATALASLKVALMTDIALLMEVPISDVVLLSVTEGSLITSFGIIARPGRSTQGLLTRFAGAGVSADWLINTAAEYRKVGNEIVRVINTGVSLVSTFDSAMGISSAFGTASLAATMSSAFLVAVFVAWTTTA